MSGDWTERTDGPTTEWERRDGTATVRVRERPDGRYVVRLDRLTQAPEGPAYRHAVVPDREAALERARAWRAAATGREG